MERIHTLIDKLYQQKAQNAPPANLLFTVQLLQQELTQLQNSSGAFQSKRVSVTLPLNLNFSEEALRTPFSEANQEKEVFQLEITEEALQPDETEVEEVPPVVIKEYTLRKPTLAEAFYEEPQPVKKEEAKPSYSSPVYNTAFDTVVTEAPTLTQYSSRKEVNHAVADRKESLNDRLKGEVTELSHRLKETPIKDLKKAIGINDRFHFVRELFRGDDAMYERSVKTINGFNIYSEAEYWIARELKLKLAWSDDNEAVQLFYNLVRRRFS